MLAFAGFEHRLSPPSAPVALDSLPRAEPRHVCCLHLGWPICSPRARRRDSPGGHMCCGGGYRQPTENRLPDHNQPNCHCHSNCRVALAIRWPWEVRRPGTRSVGQPLPGYLPRSIVRMAGAALHAGLPASTSRSCEQGCRNRASQVQGEEGTQEWKGNIGAPRQSYSSAR